MTRSEGTATRRQRNSCSFPQASLRRSARLGGASNVPLNLDIASSDSSYSRLLALPLDLLFAIVAQIPPNDIATGLRMTCHTLASALSSPAHTTIHLSSPVAPPVFRHALRHGFSSSSRDPSSSSCHLPNTGLNGLTYDEKTQLSSLLAGAGVLANLVALHTLPAAPSPSSSPSPASLFPDGDEDGGACPMTCSTPRAAAAASHLHVLQWLHGVGACMACVRVQMAVGGSSSLEVLRWYAEREDSHAPTLFAAACDDEDAARRTAKLQLLYDKHGAVVISRRAAANVAGRGDVTTLAWLRDRGADVDAAAMTAAAGGGHIAAAAWILAHTGGGQSFSPIGGAALLAAAEGGRVEMLAWLAARLPRPLTAAGRRQLLAAAAAKGAAAAVRWLLETGEAAGGGGREGGRGGGVGAGEEATAGPEEEAAVAQEALEEAAAGGHCEVVRLLLERGGAVASSQAMECAAEAGSAAVMQVLLEAALAAEAAEATAKAAAVGEVAAEVAGAGLAAGAAGMEVAAVRTSSAAADGASGLREAVAASAAARALLKPTAYVAAALAACEPDSHEGHGGRHAIGAGRGRPGAAAAATAAATASGAAAAIGRGSRGAAGGGSGAATAAAAGGGDDASGAVACGSRIHSGLAALQWLEAVGCPRGSEEEQQEVCVAAALVGSGARLGWLRRRGWSWGVRVFAAGAASGCIALVEWMLAQGCPMGRRGDALLAAGANADGAMLAALRRMGCPWAAHVLPRAVHSVLSLSARGAGGGGPVGAGGVGDNGGGGGMVVRCRLNVLKWMVAHGCPVTKQAYQVARQHGRGEVADWLKRSGLLH